MDHTPEVGGERAEPGPGCFKHIYMIMLNKIRMRLRGGTPGIIYLLLKFFIFLILSKLTEPFSVSTTYKFAYKLPCYNSNKIWSRYCV